MNHNDHHSHTKLAVVDDAEFVAAVVGVVPVELADGAAEASVVAGVESLAVAAAVAASSAAADSDNGAEQHADLTCGLALVGHGPLHCSSCCYCYCQTTRLRYYCAQPD